MGTGVFPQQSDRHADSLFFSFFSRVVARQVRIKGERSARRFRKQTVKDKNPMFPSLRDFRHVRQVYSHEGKNGISFEQCKARDSLLLKDHTYV